MLRWILLLALTAACPRPVQGEVLVPTDATWRYFPGRGEPANSPSSWQGASFDDSQWLEGPSPFFYGEAVSGTELGDMRNNYTSVYLRRTFVVRNPAEITALRLVALSDDGFAAWINGKPVARFNAPDGDLPYFATALRTFNEPLPTETYAVADFRSILVPGTNILAVQGLNISLGGSSDFLIQVALEAEIDQAPPTLLSTVPAQGSRIASLSQVTVTFDEPVQGVDAADLLINGRAATNVTAFGNDVYVFEFAPPSPGPVTVAWATGANIRDLSPGAYLFQGTTWEYTVDPDLPPPGVFLGEFLADNDRTLNDEDGDASDWIEIVNTSETAVSLAGWHLTDDPSHRDQWKFPPVTVPARGYLVVFASGKDRAPASGQLHTNFRLSAAGGYLGLYRADGSLASEFANYPPQQRDVSYGRLTTDPKAVGYFPTPTPAAANLEGGPGFSPPVRFSRIGGTWMDPFQLTLSTPDPNAAIRYTLDGTLPSETSRLYTTPITVSTSLVVRARSYTPGLLPGPVSAEYYAALVASAASLTSSLPAVLIHSFGRGSVPPNGEYPALVALYEPRNGVTSLTNAPDLRTRARVNIRGSSTLGQAKRNFSVEFRDERDADTDLEPLGLPAESDWILYAPNNFEPILIHNPLAFRLSEAIGRYAPRTRFVEVYVVTSRGPVNAFAYQGIYVLMEKIKRDANRVAVDNLEPEHVRTPEVTGGYILKIDRLDPGDSGLWAGGQAMGFVDPKEEEMNTPQRAPQRTYIQQYLDGFLSALYSPTWRDPVRGWRAYVDQDSWIDHHLLNVLTFNVDALRLSAYFYKPRNGPLEFGPVWDFDRALNSTDGRDANPRVWRSTQGDGGTDFFNYPWWGRMFEDPDFWQRYVDRYQQLRQAQFSTNAIFGLIDELVRQVLPMQPREAAKWPGFTTPRGSYEAEVSALKFWLTRRLNFMDTNFLAAPTMNLTSGTIDPGAQLTLSGPPGATLYYTLDGSDPRAPGGAVAPGALTYTGPIPLGDGRMVRARSRNPAHRNLTGFNNPPISTPWSGLSEARFTTLAQPRPGDLEFSEIHFLPAAPTPAELAVNAAWTANDFEFLEIHNPGSAPVDLPTLRITSGVTFNFASATIPSLPAGGFVTLVRNLQAFSTRYGPAAAATVAGTYTGALAGQGESLVLADTRGQVIARASYRDQWAPAADGLGFSLVRTELPPDAWPPQRRWRPSAAPGGSPGQPDPQPPTVPPVVVHELLSHPHPTQSDGVELHNPSSTPADISHWFLTDNRQVPAKYRIPPGTVLPPGGFLWIDESAFNASPASPSSFGLNATGDALWLFAAAQDGTLLGYCHGFNFGASERGVSFGRESSCEGGELLLPQRAVTPGAPNAGPIQPSAVITEIHYHPPDLTVGADAWNDTAFEFVEIANPTPQPVPLFDPAYPTNRWRLKDAVQFTFPPNVTLPPGGIALIVNFDPDNDPLSRASFVQALGVPTGVPLFGPMIGSLPNDSGRVELARPDAPRQSAGANSGTVPYLNVDAVRYGDEPPWPRSADGGGASLHRIGTAGISDRPRAWLAASPGPGRLPDASADSDGDTLPDVWESAFCLDAANPADALMDADGDRASNRDEYAARTNPLDGLDVLAWSVATRTADGQLLLEFPIKAGVSYAVERRAGRETIWTVVETIPAAAMDGTHRLLQATDADAPALYRVRLTPP